MKVGQYVYVPDLDKYGFIEEVTDKGKIKTIRSYNDKTGKFELLTVLTLVVEAVDIIKEVIKIIGMIFRKKNKVPKVKKGKKFKGVQ